MRYIQGTGERRRKGHMALKVGQLEKLSNSELQKQFIKDKARGRNTQVWQKRSYKKHLENLRNAHEQARGRHGHTKKNP